MPSSIVVDNKFIGGLKTEFTGMNFPDDSCSETFDCIFERNGTVSRRLGIDYEDNYTLSTIDRTGAAVCTYFWKNVIGDGEVPLVVMQVNATLYFFRSSSATTADPLSDNLLVSTITMSSFIAPGASAIDGTKECQFADGNGYLFVFHKDMEPLVVSYSAGTLSGIAITVRIRDFEGVSETGIEDNFRSSSLTSDHQYNLQNQGWTATASSTPWGGTSTTANTCTTGVHSWTMQTGQTISAGQVVSVVAQNTFGMIVYESGIVLSYNSGSGALILNITSTSNPSIPASIWSFSCTGTTSTNYIFDWHTAVGNYPSNADVWWLFKDSSGAFAPATAISQVTLNAGPAPKGYYILEAFNQKRATVSGVSGPSDVTTGGLRPTCGTFFAGRVWYSGVNYNKFNENVYFSQIIERTDQFGKCYQINDPTSEDRADLLPSDGGVFRIQGTGLIYKLFPITNGLIVFAERGIWLISGSQGIGFTANDFTISKISSIPTISATSFVDVQGFPMWCNEDGIYTINPAQQETATIGETHVGLSVIPLTYGTIASFYQDIPLLSKMTMRGIFNYLDYKVQWLYRDTAATSVTERYNYTNILNLDTITKAFYPWTLPEVTSQQVATINSIVVLGNNSIASGIPYKFRYLTSTLTSGGTSWNFTFSEERDTSYEDFSSVSDPINYTSYFITGYRIYTKGNTKGHIPYIDIHAVGGGTTQCNLQARWDFTTSGDEGRWSSVQRVLFDGANRSFETKRRRTRGQGRAVQLKFSSVTGHPMSLIGWSTWVEVNTTP